MKKATVYSCKALFSLVLVAACSLQSKAQWSTSGTDIYYNGGNVGIGTSAPAEKLNIEGGNILLSNNSAPTSGRVITCGSSIATLLLGTDINTTTLIASGPNIQMAGPSAWRVGGMFYTSNTGNNTTCHGFANDNSTTGTTTNLLFMIDDGGYAKVGIGNVTTPGNYGLYVERGIMTQMLKIASPTGADWADYVFAPSYSMPSLRELEIYVKKERHLPEIPSAQEVATSGIDVAQMQNKLLKKIEELTLYVIQQQKEIDRLKEKVGE